MKPPGAEIVRTFSHGEGGFGRDQHLVTTAGNRLTQNFFRHPLRVDIRSIEEVHPRFQTDVHQARSLGDIRRSPRFEELTPTAKGRCAEAEHRHLQSRIVQAV